MHQKRRSKPQRRRFRRPRSPWRRRKRRSRRPASIWDPRISRLRLQESQVKAQVQIGNLVSPAGAPITTVSTVDPIKAEFTVSEQEYLRFMEAEQQAAPCTVRKIDSNRIHW